jgi:hypothetical protein
MIADLCHMKRSLVERPNLPAGITLERDGEQITKVIVN